MAIVNENLDPDCRKSHACWLRPWKHSEYTTERHFKVMCATVRGDLPHLLQPSADVPVVMETSHDGRLLYCGMCVWLLAITGRSSTCQIWWRVPNKKHLRWNSWVASNQYARMSSWNTLERNYSWSCNLLQHEEYITGALGFPLLHNLHGKHAWETGISKQSDLHKLTSREYSITVEGNC